MVAAVKKYLFWGHEISKTMISRTSLILLISRLRWFRWFRDYDFVAYPGPQLYWLPVFTSWGLVPEIAFWNGLWRLKFSMRKQMLCHVSHFCRKGKQNLSIFSELVFADIEKRKCNESFYAVTDWMVFAVIVIL